MYTVYNTPCHVFYRDVIGILFLHINCSIVIVVNKIISMCALLELDLAYFMLIVSHLLAILSRPGPIAMTSFIQASLFGDSFGPSWCCFRSFRTLSIHLSLGLPRGLFPPTFIVVTSFASCVILHLKSIFARHGIPEIVMSDNGLQ